MSFEKIPESKAIPSSVEKEITKERRVEEEEEEERILKAEQSIDNYGTSLYAVFQAYMRQEGSTPPSYDALSLMLGRDRVGSVISSFPKDALKDDRDTRYAFSRLFRQLGKLDSANTKEKTDSALGSDDVLRECLEATMSVSGARIEKILQSKPVFYRQDEGALQDIQIEDEVRSQLPPGFSENPTSVIEKFSLVERDQGEFATDIQGLAYAPYDFTRVKKYKNFIFKRVDLAKVRYGTEEIDQSKKISALLKQLGDPRIQAQTFLGYVYDQGNVYLVARFAKGKTTQELISQYQLVIQHYRGEDFYERSEARDMCDRITNLLRKEHADLHERNLIIDLKPGTEYRDPNSVRGITVIDFEEFENVR